MKNLIYIVAIDDPNAKVSVNDFFQYAKPTWQQYCQRHGIDLIIQTEHQFDSSFKPIWNKELIHQIGVGYDKIGIVDSDTMVKWDTPNIFNIIPNHAFCGVNDIADLNWLMNSIADRQKFFPDTTMDLDLYINAGSIFFSKEYLYIFIMLLSLYRENKGEIDALQGGGKEQTLLNFILQQEDIPLHLLTPEWNLLSIHRKNMFQNNWQLKLDPTPYFIKYAYIWHFTGFPIEQRVDIMKSVWESTKTFYQ